MLTALALAALLAPVPAARASDLVEARPLTNRILMLHFKDGRVIHHTRGHKRSDERVISSPLDVAEACQPGSYSLASAEDPAYRAPQEPLRVGRKSKGTDFAWFADRWVKDHAENDRPDHTEEHWLYLFLPRPMLTGRTYTLETRRLAANGRSWRVRFDEARNLSEAVHVNLLGYAPHAPAKYAYLYHWLGDSGGLDLKPYAGHRFRLVEVATRRSRFAGRVAFRRSAENPETGQLSDTPKGNYLGADVYECDFSRFTRPGRYVVAVDGVGCSSPFRLDPDVYRSAFRTACRGLFHNRSGIALTRPHTEFVRPAPHNPRLTPGFAGKLRYTTSRFIDWRNGDADPADRPAIEAGVKGPIDVWGWYQDAGDWDSYASHIRVPVELLLTYEMAPGNFADGELNLPESGNGVPDLLDEAAWLPRFCHRLRHALLTKGWGTGGLGLRVCGDHFGGDTGPGDVGRGSWEDVDRTWIVSGEDPLSTYGYAGAAAHLAYCLKRAGVRDPRGVDWAREARETYAWASANTRPGDEGKVRTYRCYASAALFRLTGDGAYEARFRSDLEPMLAKGALWGENGWGAWVYALGGGPRAQDPALLARTRKGILATADTSASSSDRRALRWGGDWYFPMVVGQQTTPQALEIAVGWALARRAGDRARSRRYLSALYTTCDYFLGTNSLNMTWMTGLGPRHPNQTFHMDAWYNGTGRFHPGIVPYGPWRKERDQGAGPWDHDWANKTVYPGINLWPGNERWFDNRCAPLGSEFTVHQNTAPSAAIYGLLCAPRAPLRDARPASKG